MSDTVTTTTVLTRALRYGAILALAVIVIGSIIGYLVGAERGLFSALLGGALTAVFLAMTAASILIAGRVASGPEGIAVYYGIVLGVWMLKLVLFVGLAIWLRGQSWLNPGVFGFTVIAAVIGSLVVDVLAFRHSRVPYTDARLPGESAGSAEKSLGDS